MLFKEPSHRRNDFCPLDKYILDLRVHDQINIALPVAKLLVRERIVDDNISLLILCLFCNRQRTKRLCQQLDFLCMNRNFSHLRAEDKTFDANDVADIQQLERIVKVSEIILLQVDLNFPL